MEPEIKDILLALRSDIELREDFRSSQVMLKKLPERHIALLIENEIKRENFGNVISIIDELLYKVEKNSLYEKNDIKKFDFEYVTNVTIEEIKSLLEIPDSHYLISGRKSKFGWLNQWYNKGRYSIVIEIGLLKKIILNPMLGLEVKKVIIHANLGYYTKISIKESSPERTDNFSDDRSYNYNNNWLEDAAGTDDPEVMRDVYWNLD